MPSIWIRLATIWITPDFSTILGITIPPTADYQDRSSYPAHKCLLSPDAKMFGPKDIPHWIQKFDHHPLKVYFPH